MPEHRSAQEIILVRLTGDGTAPPTIKWRVSAPWDCALHLSLVANGPLLMLAFSGNLIPAYVLDWAKL